MSWEDYFWVYRKHAMAEITPCHVMPYQMCMEYIYVCICAYISNTQIAIRIVQDSTINIVSVPFSSVRI